MPEHKHNYIICIYDDHYELRGPFRSQRTLEAAGEKWQRENGDRPTWQSVYLADPTIRPTIISPSGKRHEQRRLIDPAAITLGQIDDMLTQWP
jgi:hypothetical protein